MNLHRVDVAESRTADWDDNQLRRAVGLTSSITPPPPPALPPPLAGEDLEPRRYGTGRPEVRLTAGSVSGPGQGTGEIGLWMGDTVGRHEVMAFYSGRAEDPGLRGALTWRGLPVRLRLDASLLNMADPTAELSAARLQHWRGGGLDIAAGGWMRDGGFNGGATAELGHWLWTGPVWWGGSLSGEVAAGSEGLITTGGGNLSGGVSAIELGVSGRFSQSDTTGLTLGGLPDPLRPELSDMPWIWAPGLAPGTDTGDTLTWARVETGLWNTVFVYAEHYALSTTHSQIGLEARLYTPPQPLARLSALEMSAGIACRLSTAGVVDATPCAQAEDFSGWLGVLIRPGRTPYFPER